MGTETERVREQGWRRTKERKMRTRTRAGTRRGREQEQGWKPEDDYRIGTGTGEGNTRAVAEMETGTRVGAGTGMRTRTGKVGERRRSARNRTRVVDAMWEKSET